jgi:hypothetical protein
MNMNESATRLYSIFYHNSWVKNNYTNQKLSRKTMNVKRLTPKLRFGDVYKALVHI